MRYLEEIFIFMMGLITIAFIVSGDNQNAATVVVALVGFVTGRLVKNNGALAEALVKHEAKAAAASRKRSVSST